MSVILVSFIRAIESTIFFLVWAFLIKTLTILSLFPKVYLIVFGLVKHFSWTVTLGVTLGVTNSSILTGTKSFTKVSGSSVLLDSIIIGK